MAQVAIKFEHETSKGCSPHGKPSEWGIYGQIGDCHGIPKVYAKGSKDGFHIMVSNCLSASLTQRRHMHPCCCCHSTLLAATAALTGRYGSMLVPSQCLVGRRGSVMVQIMELLGPSLWDVWKKTEKSLGPEYAACVAVEALTILEDLHRRG